MGRTIGNKSGLRDSKHGRKFKTLRRRSSGQKHHANPRNTKQMRSASNNDVCVKLDSQTLHKMLARDNNCTWRLVFADKHVDKRCTESEDESSAESVDKSIESEDEGSAESEDKSTESEDAGETTPAKTDESSAESDDDTSAGGTIPSKSSESDESDDDFISSSEDLAPQDEDDEEYIPKQRGRG